VRLDDRLTAQGHDGAVSQAHLMARSVVTMGANLTTVDGQIDAIKPWREVYNSAP
jgi:hypothetical protein